MNRLLLGCSGLLAACYGPTHENCRIECGPGGACPVGSVCRNGFCSAGDEVACLEPPLSVDAPAVADGAAPFDGAAGATDAPAPAPCLAPYLALGTSCYRFGTAAQLWREAEEDCELEGGHLVVLDDEAEQTLVYANSGGHDVWIGLSDLAVPETYRWVTGMTLGYRDPVFDIEPADGCVELGASSNDWWTKLCGSDLNRAVCERDGVPADPTAF